MSKLSYDLVVAYRIYPAVSKTPLVFQDNKYKLAELCVKSFKKSLGDLKVKLIVLLDNCPGEYKVLFETHFDTKDLLFKEYQGIGNQATFAQQIDLLLEQNDSEYIYFAEDDYFYLENRFSDMIRFLKNNKDADFVSPYDHPDNYSRFFHAHPHKIRVKDSVYWRTCQSTCLTFLTTKKVLKKTAKIFRTYVKGNHDFAVWAALTKFAGLNAFSIIRSFVKEIYFLKLYALTWLHGWWQVLFGRKYTLWAPVPSIATHMQNDGIAPVVDWENEINRLIN